MNIPPVGGPSIPIVFDFNKAPPNALQVPSEPNFLGVKAVFTTNASQWEPGEFVNGVVSFGPNENVFILHNAGTAQGSNQRYVAVQLNNPVALRLVGMRFRSHTNAFGCSPENPVVLAVEAATRDDFADAAVLGTIPTFGGPLAEKSLPLGVRVFPAGPINIRLRSTSPVPDGSNYIAYIDFGLAVSPLQSWQPPVIQPHADVGPIEATSAEGAIVTYDPALATDDSGAAPAITYSQESGTLFPIGITTVTVTAKDAANNTATSTFTVKVVATPHLVVEQPPGTPLASGSAIVAWGYNQFGQTNVPDGLTDVRAIAAGFLYTVALKSDGTVIAWGANHFGQTNVPGGLTGVQAVAAGLGHTVALKSDGTVLAWGDKNYGQTSVPDGLTDVQAIAAGWYHTVALKSDGTLVTWGFDPMVPGLVTDVQGIAAGRGYTVILRKDGTVLAWGANYLGQMNVPDGLTNVRAIAAGAEHIVTLKSDGTVLAWGTNVLGQTSVPQGLRDVRAISAGQRHNVALKSDGTVVAWGDNSALLSTVPDGLRGVRAIAAGGSHTVALVRESVDFARQQMGESSAPKTFLLKNPGLAALNISGASVTGENPGDFSVDTRSVSPRVAPGTETALSVTFQPGAIGHRSATLRVASNDSATPNFDIALTGEGADITPPIIQPHADVGPIEATSADGAVVTYDPALAKDDSGATPTITYSQESGTLFPIGTTTVTVTAKDAANNTATSTFTVTVVATPHLVVEQPPGTPLLSGSVLVAWGDNQAGQTNVPDGLTDVRAIAAGGLHTVALKSDGTVVAWGDNRFGQTNVPGGLTGVQAVAAGAAHTVALKSDGTVFAWGDTSEGQNSEGQTMAPAGLTGVKAIAAGWYHTVALKSDSTAVTWGAETSVPDGLFGVEAIAAGEAHTVALKSDGTVLAWGDNHYGQTSVPDLLANVGAIAAGGGHTVALKSDGTVLAWGDNSAGQTSVPQGLGDVRAISAGKLHTVALKSDGTVLAWGDNGGGQTSVPDGLRGVRAIAAGGSYTVALVRASVDFGRQKMGDSSAAKTFLLKNTGLAALNISGATVTGENPGDFSVDTRSMSPRVAPGTETALSIAFKSGAIGNRSATLRVGSNDPATPNFDIGLTGEGADITPPIIQAHADVGPIVATSARGAIVTYEPVMAKDDSGMEPIITYSKESGTLFPIGTTIVNVTAKDAANNMARTQFKVTVVAAPRLVIEQPAGTPLPEMPNVIFDGQDPGISSAAKTFTLKNAGSAPLEIGGIIVNGDHADDFTIDTRAMAGSLAPGGETTFSITFTPSAIGNRAAILRVASNDTATPTFYITLSGVGWDAPPMIAPHENVGPIEATSSAGAIVTYEPAIVTGVVQTIAYSRESGTVFPLGVTTVTITATDAANRTATASFTVTVTVTVTGRPQLAIEQPPGTLLAQTTRVVAWGSNSQGQTKAPSDLTDAQAIAAGGYHTVALKKNGTVVAWGAKGQGRTTVPDRLTDVQAIAAGIFHTIALRSDGTVAGWGDNTQGQTTMPPESNDARVIAAGGYHNLVLKDGGTVFGWGDNSRGQITVPLELTSVRAIAAGQFHSVALKNDGTIASWGDNRFGQSSLPEEGLAAVRAIAAGALHTVALLETGTVVAWGSNEFHQRDVPEDVRDVQAIAAGRNFTAALKADGTIAAWGENSHGQINVPAGLTYVQAIAAGVDHVVALVRVLPSTDFGRRIPGRSVAKTFALNNTGTMPLTIISATVIGKNPGDFSVGAPDLTSVPAGSQVTLVITFIPAAVGNRAAILRVVTDDPVNPNYDVQLTGTGFTPQAIA